jgi:hypothetical protein
VGLPQRAAHRHRFRGEQLEGIQEVIASDWPASNSVILESLFQVLDSQMLESESSGSETEILAEILVAVAVTSGSQAQARGALLGMLTCRDRAGEWKVQCLAETLTELDAPARDRMQASEILLKRLPDTVLWMVSFLLDGAVRLAVTAEEQARTREALLRMLSSETALLQLSSSEKDPVSARKAAQAIAKLSPTVHECTRAREALMGLLARETNAVRARHLAYAFPGLAPSRAERQQILDAVLRLIPAETRPGSAWRLDEVLPSLAMTDEEQARTRASLLGLLAGETDPEKVQQLASAVAELAPTEPERAETLRALLKAEPQITGYRHGRNLARTVPRLAVTTAEKAHARKAVLELLPSGSVDSAVALAEALAQLTPTAPERIQALGALLGRESAGMGFAEAEGLANVIQQLAITVAEQAQAREGLLRNLAGETDPVNASYYLASALFGLSPSAREDSQVRESLLRILTADGLKNPESVAIAVALLDPSASEQAQVRVTLLGFIASQADPFGGRTAASVLSLFKPMLADLADTRNWVSPSPVELLAAVRSNSRLFDWIAALPQIS